MKFVIPILFIFITAVSLGQQSADTVVFSGGESEFQPGATEAAGQKHKVLFNLEFGTAVGASRYGSYFGTYVAPHLTYPVNNRFSISAGGYFAGISPAFHSGETAFRPDPFGSYYMRSYVYVEGAYRLNQNLTLSGTVYKEINPFGSQASYPGYNSDIKGLIMGIDYRISDHVFIRGEVEVSNGHRPLRYDPFMNPAGSPMYDPFFYRP